MIIYHDDLRFHADEWTLMLLLRNSVTLKKFLSDTILEVIHFLQE